MATTRQKTRSGETRQYWQSHNDAYKKSGLTRATYCEQHKINLKTFAYWRHKIKTDSTPVKLVQLPQPVWQPSAALRLEVNGYSVDVCDGFSPSALAKLVRVLREL